jgi:hypothetical protein
VVCGRFPEPAEPAAARALFREADGCFADGPFDECLPDDDLFEDFLMERRDNGLLIVHLGCS